MLLFLSPSFFSLLVFPFLSFHKNRLSFLLYKYITFSLFIYINQKEYCACKINFNNFDIFLTECFFVIVKEESLLQTKYHTQRGLLVGLVDTSTVSNFYLVQVLLMAKLGRNKNRSVLNLICFVFTWFSFLLQPNYPELCMMTLDLL